MPSESSARPDVSRREVFLSAAAGAAAAWLAGLESAAADVAGQRAGCFKAYDQVEPQQFAWGWIRWLMNAQIDPQAEMTLGIVHVEPKQSNPLHVHPNSAEYVHMLSGTCEHRVGDRWFTLKAGDTLRIPKGVPHVARTGEQPFQAMIVYDTGTRQMVTLPESGTTPK